MGQHMCNGHEGRQDPRPHSEVSVGPQGALRKEEGLLSCCRTLCFWNQRDRSFIASSVAWPWPLDISYNISWNLSFFNHQNRQITPPVGLLQDEAADPTRHWHHGPRGCCGPSLRGMFNRDPRASEVKAPGSLSLEPVAVAHSIVTQCPPCRSQLSDSL